ncbi:MAG: aspartate-semialdehyde dehydrogenase, partial [Proteobacteria bacterium]
GAAAVDELKQQSADVLAGKPANPQALAHPIAFNLIPQIGGFLEDGSTSEELKVRDESRKILGMPKLPVTCTAVRVPTVKSHGESVLIEFGTPFDLEHMKAALRAHSGITVLDDPKNRVYPMNQTYGVKPELTVSGTDNVAVGRVRRDLSSDQGLQLWILSDNLRKGAALNAIQMAEGILPELLARRTST